MNDEQFWNLFCRYYVSCLEAHHYPMAQILFDSLDMQKAQDVLEVGTGSGYNLKNFLIQKPKTCHWVATDICETMLQFCQQRIEEFAKNPFDKIEHNFMTQQFPKFEEKKIDVLNLSLKKADAHNLKQFESNSFDRYFANHVIGNRPDREAILKEAMRVLKPNGLLGFTVFGRRENCKWFTLVKDVAIEQGVDPAKFPASDEFDKMDKAIIVSQLEQTGFKIIQNFYVQFPIFNPEIACTKQAIQQQLSKVTQDELMQEKIFVAVENKLKVIRESKTPLTMEALYFIALKEAK